METLPDKAKLGSQSWSLVPKNKEWVEEAGIFGDCNRIEQRIRYAQWESQEPSQVAATVLHELVHACWSEAALPDDLEGIDEEEVVSRLTPQLLNLLAQNPTLIDTLRRMTE